METEVILSQKEQDELERYETIIKDGLHTFLLVGEVLKLIKVKRLWRKGYFSSYKQYCWVKWTIGYARGYQLISIGFITDKYRDLTKCLIKHLNHTKDQRDRYNQELGQMRINNINRIQRIKRIKQQKLLRVQAIETLQPGRRDDGTILFDENVSNLKIANQASIDTMDWILEELEHVHI